VCVHPSPSLFDKTHLVLIFKTYHLKKKVCLIFFSNFTQYGNIIYYRISYVIIPAPSSREESTSIGPVAFFFRSLTKSLLMFLDRLANSTRKKPRMFLDRLVADTQKIC